MIFIDLTPYRCPVPLVKLKMAVKAIGVGDSLHVQLSDSGSRQDVPAFFKNQGHSVEIIQDDENRLCVVITKLR